MLYNTLLSQHKQLTFQKTNNFHCSPHLDKNMDNQVNQTSEGKYNSKNVFAKSSLNLPYIPYYFD